MWVVSSGKALLKTKKRQPKSIFQLSPLVELEGFEPSSKQGTDKLSTRLLCYWFSRNVRKQTP